LAVEQTSYGRTARPESIRVERPSPADWPLMWRCLRGAPGTVHDSEYWRAVIATAG